MKYWTILVGLVYFLCFECSKAFVAHHGAKAVHQKTNKLYAEKTSKTKGVYARPSAAIERGSGFFIPGLEGPRVRLVFGLIIMVLTTLNHFLLSTTTESFTELLAIAYAILLLLQAAIEFGKEEKGFIVSLNKENLDGSPNRATELDLVQRWSALDEMSEILRERVQWLAATYLSLTPANRILLLDNKRVLFCLGSSLDLEPDQEHDACSAVMKTLSKSKSGRLSLPSSHPAAKLVAAEESRCLVVQAVKNDKCLLVSSTQLLAAFTEQDLKWLGQFGVLFNV